MTSPTLERKDLGTLSAAIREAERKGLAHEKAHGLESLIEQLVSTAELTREQLSKGETIELSVKSDEPSDGPSMLVEELTKVIETLGIPVTIERSKFFTPQEAANMLGVSKQTVINWIKDGKIRAERTPGGHFRIPVEDFFRFHNRYEAFRTYRPKSSELAEMSDEELVEDLKEYRKWRKSRRSEHS